jgi:hypothetical protein
MCSASLCSSRQNEPALDRRSYSRSPYEAKKRFGLAVLNFHRDVQSCSLLVKDNDPGLSQLRVPRIDAVPASLVQCTT